MAHARFAGVGSGPKMPPTRLKEGKEGKSRCCDACAGCCECGMCCIGTCMGLFMMSGTGIAMGDTSISSGRRNCCDDDCCRNTSDDEEGEDEASLSTVDAEIRRGRRRDKKRRSKLGFVSCYRGCADCFLTCCCIDRSESEGETGAISSRWNRFRTRILSRPFLLLVYFMYFVSFGITLAVLLLASFGGPYHATSEFSALFYRNFNSSSASTARNTLSNIPTIDQILSSSTTSSITALPPTFIQNLSASPSFTTAEKNQILAQFLGGQVEMSFQLDQIVITHTPNPKFIVTSSASSVSVSSSSSCTRTLTLPLFQGSDMSFLNLDPSTKDTINDATASINVDHPMRQNMLKSFHFSCSPSSQQLSLTEIWNIQNNFPQNRTTAPPTSSSSSSSSFFKTFSKSTLDICLFQYTNLAAIIDDFLFNPQGSPSYGTSYGNCGAIIPIYSSAASSSSSSPNSNLTTILDQISHETVQFWRRAYFDLLRPLTCRERFSTYADGARMVSKDRIVKLAVVSVFFVLVLGLVGDGQAVRRTYSAESCMGGIVPIAVIILLSLILYGFAIADFLLSSDLKAAATRSDLCPDPLMYFSNNNNKTINFVPLAQYGTNTDFALFSTSTTPFTIPFSSPPGTLFQNGWSSGFFFAKLTSVFCFLLPTPWLCYYFYFVCMKKDGGCGDDDADREWRSKYEKMKRDSTAAAAAASGAAKRSSSLDDDIHLGGGKEMGLLVGGGIGISPRPREIEFSVYDKMGAASRMPKPVAGPGAPVPGKMIMGGGGGGGGLTSTLTLPLVMASSPSSPAPLLPRHVAAALPIHHLTHLGVGGEGGEKVIVGTTPTRPPAFEEFSSLAAAARLKKYPELGVKRNNNKNINNNEKNRKNNHNNKGDDDDDELEALMRRRDTEQSVVVVMPGQLPFGGVALAPDSNNQKKNGVAADPLRNLVEGDKIRKNTGGGGGGGLHETVKATKVSDESTKSKFSLVSTDSLGML